MRAISARWKCDSVVVNSGELSFSASVSEARGGAAFSVDLAGAFASMDFAALAASVDFAAFVWDIV
ncbi:hypothetical protein, partial [Mesorhizobium sp.]|uniref:hypothetical protein n=1 Tax=Mesorhizobium sp. TaxID=1871066 RepID=UPI0025C6A116